MTFGDDAGQNQANAIWAYVGYIVALLCCTVVLCAVAQRGACGARNMGGHRLPEFASLFVASSL